jgi:hypothetical protein
MFSSYIWLISLMIFIYKNSIIKRLNKLWAVEICRPNGTNVINPKFSNIFFMYLKQMYIQENIIIIFILSVLGFNP